MKRLFLTAVLSLFAINAYAVEIQVIGAYDITGNYVVNNNLGDGGDKGQENQDRAYMEQNLYILTRFLIDPKVTLNLRSYILHQSVVAAGYTYQPDKGMVYLDRFWIGYKPTEAFKVEIGRITGNNYTSGFASGMYDGSFGEMGGRDQIRATYNINNNASIYAVYTAHFESSTQDPGETVPDNEGNGRDIWSVVAGANAGFGNLFVNPYISYYYDHNTTNRANGANGYAKAGQLFSLYLEAGVKPAAGINLLFAAGYSANLSGDNSTVTAKYGKDYTVYGAYLDLSYVTEIFKVGGLAAYSSYDKKKGYFQFGGDFDKTLIMDMIFGEGGEWDYLGVPASTVFQLYANVNLPANFSLDLSGSYYTSNVTENAAPAKYFDMLFGEDTNAYEIDAVLSYKFTESTVFSIGAAYAKINDLLDNQTGEKYSPDAMIKAFWTVSTNF